MDVLDSQWLLRMLSRAGDSPAERLTALFDILQDWLDAPHLREVWQHQAPCGDHPRLLNYLKREATAGGAASPDELAHQVLFLAIGALQEELRSPDCGALAYARQAVQLLVDMELGRARGRSTSTRRMAALATLAVSVISGMLVADGTGRLPGTLPTSTTGLQVSATPLASSISPDQVAALHDSLERIRQGQCMYPQALMLPASQRAIFLENFIDGWTPGPQPSMRELQELASKVDCYYPPVAMTTG